jgi:septum formation protein
MAGKAMLEEALVTVARHGRADSARGGGAAGSGGDPKALPGRRLILASQSPRRRLLLAEHGFDHHAHHPGLDDADLARGQVSPEQWVAALAYLKARAGADSLAERPARWTVIGADTVCVKDGELLGQPRDAADAERMLRRLENGQHEVVTGVAILSSDNGQTHDRALLVDRARVRVGTLGEPRIRAYVATGQWRGKAGAYNLSERLADGWPIALEGDPATVMGLPMRRLSPILRSRLEPPA